MRPRGTHFQVCESLYVCVSCSHGALNFVFHTNRQRTDTPTNNMLEGVAPRARGVGSAHTSALRQSSGRNRKPPRNSMQGRNQNSSGLPGPENKAVPVGFQCPKKPCRSHGMQAETSAPAPGHICRDGHLGPKCRQCAPSYFNRGGQCESLKAEVRNIDCTESSQRYLRFPES